MDARVVLITGAAQGLGEYLTRAFHEAGYRVGISDIDAAGAEALAQELDASGDTARSMPLDVRKQEDFEAAETACCSPGAGSTRWLTMLW